jgi:hypothetical protein
MIYSGRDKGSKGLGAVYPAVIRDFAATFSIMTETTASSTPSHFFDSTQHLLILESYTFPAAKIL